MIEVRCPRCSSLLRVAELEIGTTGHCERCKGHISILTAVDPTPYSEAPPAFLAKAHDPHVKTDAQQATLMYSSDSGDPDRDLLVRILIDLNQLLHLIRYLRNEIPEDEEFEHEREERRKWVEEMGNFGGALLESNAKSRLDDVQELYRRLQGDGYEKLYQSLQKGIDTPARLKSEDLKKAIDITKSFLAALDDDHSNVTEELSFVPKDDTS